MTIETNHAWYSSSLCTSLNYSRYTTMPLFYVYSTKTIASALRSHDESNHLDVAIKACFLIWLIQEMCSVSTHYDETGTLQRYLGGVPKTHA